jgi:hypothetical protein
MVLRDMEYDRPRLEQGEIAFFIGRNLLRCADSFISLNETRRTS